MLRTLLYDKHALRVEPNKGLKMIWMLDGTQNLGIRKSFKVVSQSGDDSMDMTSPVRYGELLFIRIRIQEVM